MKIFLLLSFTLAACKNTLLFSIVNTCEDPRTLREALASALSPDARTEFLASPATSGSKDDVPFGNLLAAERDEILKPLLLQAVSAKIRDVLGEVQPIPEPKLNNLANIGVFVVNVFDDRDEVKTALRDVVETLPCLKYRPEFDQKVQVESPTTRSVTPNDPMTMDAWHLGAFPGMNASNAWQNFTGQNADVVVAVVDSGCSMHPDLEQNLCLNDDTCDSWDHAEDNANAFNEPLTAVHGTLVSGCVAAVGNNQFGSSGVCWGCKIACMKVADENGNMWVSVILEAYDYMLETNIRISNHSYGLWTKNFQAMKTAIEALEREGHLFIAASGNDNRNLESAWTYELFGYMIPGSLDVPNIITVSASDTGGTRASFSNYGATFVDLFAPGTEILTTKNTMQGDAFGSTQGTSFSSPIVAGAAGLLLAANPTLTYPQIKEALMSTVRKVPTLNGLAVTGGILDLDAALASIDILTEEGPIISHPPPTGDNTHLAYEADGAGCRQASIVAGLVTIVGTFLL